jgi:hypothetical protein
VEEQNPFVEQVIVRSAFALLDPKAGDEKAGCVIIYEYEMRPLRETENEIFSSHFQVSAYLWYHGCYENFCFLLVSVYSKQMKNTSNKWVLVYCCCA